MVRPVTHHLPISVPTVVSIGSCPVSGPLPRMLYGMEKRDWGIFSEMRLRRRKFVLGDGLLPWCTNWNLLVCPGT